MLKNNISIWNCKNSLFWHNKTSWFGMWPEHLVNTLLWTRKSLVLQLIERNSPKQGTIWQGWQRFPFYHYKSGLLYSSCPSVVKPTTILKLSVWVRQAAWSINPSHSPAGRHLWKQITRRCLKAHRENRHRNLVLWSILPIQAVLGLKQWLWTRRSTY